MNSVKAEEIFNTLKIGETLLRYFLFVC